MKLPYSEDVNYWKTSRSSSDSWIEKAKREITKLGGKVLMEAFGNEPTSGRSAFLLTFEIQGDCFKVVWPILPTRSKNEKAAKVQAATFLYHDIKAKVLSAAILGVRASFFSYLMLPDGRSVSEITSDEIISTIPELFAPSRLVLSAGDAVVDGDYSELGEELGR